MRTQPPPTGEASWRSPEAQGPAKLCSVLTQVGRGIADVCFKLLSLL